MGWSENVWTAAETIKRQPHEVIYPDPQRTEVVQQRARMLERKRKHMIRASRW
jgi:predicted nicotinamide N-methyase